MQNRNKNRFYYLVLLVTISYGLFYITSRNFTDGRLLSNPYSNQKEGIMDAEILLMINQVKPASGLKLIEEKLKAIKESTETATATATPEDDAENKIFKLKNKDMSSQPATIKSRPFPKVPFSLKNVQDLDFRIYSHNVRNGVEKSLMTGELKWEDRSKQVASSISFHAMPNTIVALQDVNDFQLNDIISELNRYSDPEVPEWKSYGVGNIDAKNSGQFVPILYRPSEWEVIFNDSFWLNEVDQRKAYPGWDAKSLKIASFVTLKSKLKEDYINVFNTQLDKKGKKSKKEAIKLLTRRMEDVNPWPSFLCGELDFEPIHEALANSEYYIDLEQLSSDVSYGHTGSTVTGFEGEVLLKGGKNSDYIICPSYTSRIGDKSCKETKRGLNPVLILKRRGILHSKFNGEYISDHRPVVADFILRGQC